jgi:predicted Zn-dependent protease with MMP-like domain
VYGATDGDASAADGEIPGYIRRYRERVVGSGRAPAGLRVHFERCSYSVADFDAVVRRAVDSLPSDLRESMSNVEIVVEDENPEDPDLFGLYVGIPLTERDSAYAGVLPDKIEIYRLPLEEEFGHDAALLEEEIRITVLHELAHHFGIDDDRLDELGWS